MPSSTSSSESRSATRAIVALLLGLSLFCIALEWVTRRGFAEASHIQHRIVEDLRAARALSPVSAGDARTVLVVGNSLLLMGVDRDSLNRWMAPRYATALLPIENTQYEDWYFGVRRLFQEGSHPAAMVVCLSTRQMMTRITFGEFFARFLMPKGGLLVVRRASRLNNTTTSEYFFASYSEWLGSRGQIKKWLLQAVLPGVQRLVGFFPAPPAPMPPPAQVVAACLPNLMALDRECRAHGTHLVVVVPPTRREDASSEVQRAAARLGVSVLVPIRPGEVPEQEFSDGYHLNPSGAQRFTQRLARDLRTAMDAW